MKILFTTNNRIGSRFIRWGTDGDCSHIALVFEEDIEGSGIVFHSTGAKGTHPIWLKDFLSHNVIIYALDFSPDLEVLTEDTIFKSIVTDHTGQGYDFKALLFWFVMGGRKKLFKTPIPAKNEWAVAGYYLCTGLMESVQQHLPSYFWGFNIDWEMLSPTEMYHLLKSRDGFKDAKLWIDQLCLSKV